MVQETTRKKIVERAQSQKKISKFTDSTEIIFNVINYVNAMDEFDVEIWPGYLLSDVPVLSEFKDFVTPASIRMEVNNLRTKDLIIRDVDVELKYSYAEYIDALDVFRSNFKSDTNSDMDNFGNLRKFVSLFDVLDKVSVNGKAKLSEQHFVPIQVVPEVISLFTDRYFNEDADVVLNDYVTTMKFR